MINDFLIGCDPEFVLMNEKGQIVNSADSPLYWTDEGQIGWDHNGRVQEFRPEPCKGTFALVRRIGALIRDKKVTDLNYKLRAGGRAGTESLGGHVHFGFPASKYADDEWGEQLRDLTDKTKQAIPALDTVTRLLEHLDILPLQESANRRKGTFGKFGDIRDSSGHMEYRTMASWLYDPRVAYLCLTAAKLAAADPSGALEALKNASSFAGLEGWVARYKGKDTNATRAIEKIFAKGHKAVQIDPDVDIRERWGSLGL